MMKTLILSASLVTLAACSETTDAIIFDKTLGPRTEAQIKNLPDDLRGDEKNKNLSTQELKTKSLEDEGEE